MALDRQACKEIFRCAKALQDVEKGDAGFAVWKQDPVEMYPFVVLRVPSTMESRFLKVRFCDETRVRKLYPDIMAIAVADGVVCLAHMLQIFQRVWPCTHAAVFKGRDALSVMLTGTQPHQPGSTASASIMSTNASFGLAYESQMTEDERIDFYRKSLAQMRDHFCYVQEGVRLGVAQAPSMVHDVCLSMHKGRHNSRLFMVKRVQDHEDTATRELAQDVLARFYALCASV